MDEDFPVTLHECLKILEESIHLLTDLENQMEDEKEDQIVPNMDLYDLYDMTEDVHYSSKIKNAEFNLAKRKL